MSLPVALNSSQLNLIEYPACVAINNCSFTISSISPTYIISSFSFNLIAFNPELLIFLNSLRLVFLTVPSLVTNITSFSFEKSLVFIIALIFSSVLRFIIFPINLPLDCLEVSGISYTFILYTLPWFVNIISVSRFIADSIFSTKSSSTVFWLATPLPPLF